MESQRATGSAAIATSFTFTTGPVWLDEIRLHLSAAGGAANMTITINRGAGAVYDLVIVTQDMTAVVNYHYIPTRPIFLYADDTLDIAWANGSSRTYGLEILHRRAP